MPESLLDFIPAFFRKGGNGRSQEKKPEWLDMNKYRRGQKFVRDHYTSILISNVGFIQIAQLLGMDCL